MQHLGANGITGATGIVCPRQFSSQRYLSFATWTYALGPIKIRDSSRCRADTAIQLAIAIETCLLPLDFAHAIQHNQILVPDADSRIHSATSKARASDFLLGRYAHGVPRTVVAKTDPRLSLLVNTRQSVITSPSQRCFCIKIRKRTIRRLPQKLSVINKRSVGFSAVCFNAGQSPTYRFTADCQQCSCHHVQDFLHTNLSIILCCLLLLPRMLHF